MTPTNQEFRPTSLFHEPHRQGTTLELKLPQWKASDAEYLLGLNDLLDDLQPSLDHGSLSGVGLHRTL